MKATNKYQAVLTADIVNSTLLSNGEEKKLLVLLSQSLKDCRYEFYRGDSFQAIQPNPDRALRTALLCRTAAISLNQEKTEHQFDIRLSIGIATIHEPIASIQTSKEIPFVLSGKNFDSMAKSGDRLSIITSNKLATAGMNVIANYADDLLQQMTGRQAGVIFELLKGQTQQDVAELLGKSKSTIHQHVSAGKFYTLEKLDEQYQHIIKLIE